MRHADRFDYVVVGAGSAGCAVAARLSEDPSVSVCLLEAGPRDWNPWIHIPVGYFRTMNNPSVDWCYETAPGVGIAGRSLKWPRGKVLGGSSSLNGLLYVRGQAEDYDRWRQMGCEGWGYDDVLPLFKRAEDQERGANEWHGAGGPLAVTDMRLKRPICDAWVEAAQAAGYPFNPDYNGASQEGVGYFQLTAKNGRRCSAAVGYLKPARKRPNLVIRTGSPTRRIMVQDGRAMGVLVRGGEGDRVIRANREVIVSAGAIATPQILMLSGIGPRDHLAEHGIEPVIDAPGVGENLQDHLQARAVFKCNEPTLNDEVRSWPKQAGIAIRYAATRSGPMTMAASLAVGFLKTGDHVATPDIQFHIQPWSADSPGEGPHRFSAFTMSVCQLRPESRGTVRLASSDPDEHPIIDPNYLATKTDCDTIVEGVKIARRIAEREPLRSKIASEFQPGRDVQSDEEILRWVRETATTIYHPTGTCRMGAEGSSAPLDARLRLRGVEGLRVADASVMPEIVSGNTNAPAIMIGEKCADMVREDAAAPSRSSREAA